MMSETGWQLLAKWEAVFSPSSMWYRRVGHVTSGTTCRAGLASRNHPSQTRTCGELFPHELLVSTLVYDCCSCFYGGLFHGNMHGAITLWNAWIKNCISSTMQRIQMGLVPLRWWEPSYTFQWHQYHFYSEKLRKFTVRLLRERSTQYISDTLRNSASKAARTTNIRRAVAGSCIASWWYKNLAAICFKEGTKCMIRSRLLNVSDSQLCFYM